MSHLEHVALPEFGLARELPEITFQEYLARLDAAVEAMARQELDFMVVYADREHFANMAYLTGFDPRFEEALLLLDRQGGRKLLVGNECMGYLPDPRLGCEAELFQAFSLLGQPRTKSRALRAILSSFGIGTGTSVGCVGAKYFAEALVEGGDYALDVPSYLVDLLRDITGSRELVRNATVLFVHPEYGLRIRNTADQIAQFEFAAMRTSEGVRTVMQRITPGVVERDLEHLLDSAGLPLTCHKMIGFGEKARRGLASPSDIRAHLGDAYTVGFGIWGALNSRAGVVAHGPEELAGELRAFYPRFAANYMDVVFAWYESVALGVPVGKVCAAVEARRDASLYDFAVNPGHYIHLEEWVHSPFEPDSTIPLASGVALQMDIIPLSKGPFCYANAEDTLVLADESLQAELAARHPACWGRIQARRAFMVEKLGVALDSSLLPLCNTPGWLPPYVLNLGQVLVKD
ncbi:MAG: aminopeptidase P family N-terminal domain-containing protein [Anaerolineae bacterium]